jgi:hypothetical protein
MHFHPHKRGERKMSAAEARRGGKPGDLDPPMELLKQNWLREVEEVVGDGPDAGELLSPGNADESSPQALPPPAIKKIEAKSPLTPTTPSARMAIDNIVD